MELRNKKLFVTLIFFDKNYAEDNPEFYLTDSYPLLGEHIGRHRSSAEKKVKRRQDKL